MSHPRDPERKELGPDATEAELRLRAIRDLHSPWHAPPGHKRIDPPLCGGCDTEGAPFDVRWPCETRRLADGLPEPKPQQPQPQPWARNLDEDGEPELTVAEFRELERIAREAGLL